MGKYIAGIIMIAVGTIMVIKTEWFLDFFGAVDWAESHLGSEGGTRVFYKLLGVTAIILAFLLMAGIVESGLTWIFFPNGK